MNDFGGIVGANIFYKRLLYTKDVFRVINYNEIYHSWYNVSKYEFFFEPMTITFWDVKYTDDNGRERQTLGMA